MKAAKFHWLSLVLAIVAGVSGLLLIPSSTGHSQGLVCSAFGGGPPFNFQTYEATVDRQPYLAAQQLASQNLLFPTDPAFAFNELLVGPVNARQPTPQPAVPVQLLNAIGWVESQLIQASPRVPYESVGDVLISSSCAYGLMQVASSFNNTGGIPTRSESLAGSHYAYNVAAGVRVLADKWNAEFFPVVGQSNHRIIESWYYATWAYNGWALSNHPAGVEVDPFRQLPYACDGPFNGYAYQELVFGCLSNPPTVDGVALWQPLDVNLPDLPTLVQFGGPLHPDAFFRGWSTVFAAPFTGVDASRPFAEMNLPAPSAAIVPPQPTISPANAAAARATILGEAALAVDQTAVEVSVTEERTDQATITIQNTGTGLLVYRLVPQQEWIGVDVPAGIAVGSGVPLMAGAQANATISLDLRVAGLPEGLHEGSIMVEALLPNGVVDVRWKSPWSSTSKASPATKRERR